MYKHYILSIAMAGCLSPLVATAEGDSSLKMDAVEIIGDSSNARVLPGSGNVVDEKQLEIEGTTDIHQAFKTVPAIYVREEDGEGLRPNIGIRGAIAERSSNITLMEDGVLIAPAPYSNPAAYYFPTMMRIYGVEILKGAPLLRYGPQTTGGVINLLSTPIPTKRNGMIEAIVDERGSTDLQANYGDVAGNWSWLLETVQRNGDGFKDIDRSNRDTGFDIEDYVGKLRWQGDRNALQLKLQYSEEISNETYLGLTDDDFDDDPNRRYGLSSIDQMDSKHYSYVLTHEFDWTDNIKSITTGYYNDFTRNWFKLSDGNDFINPANAGDLNAQGILDGTVDEAGLEYKNNNRDYESKGIQTNFDIEWGAHQFALGARYHEDEMDRFQPVEIYDQVNGSLIFQGINQPTGSNNRFETAEAISLWALDQWQVTDRFKLNLALRYEDVETSRKQYADVNRNIIDEKRSNKSEEWLPGASFTYDVGDRWQVLAGVHRGFTPLGGGAKKNEDPETSANWEGGLRFFGDNLFVEAIGFYSDFENKVENCSVGSPCSNGATSGTFNTGEAEIAGLEFQLATEFHQGNFIIPVNLTYTYTSAEISKDNPASGLNDGDDLKEVPENLFSARIGIEHSSGWNNYAVAKYIDKMCMEAGCNNTDTRFDESQSLFVVDLISQYSLDKNTDVFLRAVNIFDEQEIVSRLPDGARPNKPRTVSAGLIHRF